MPTPRFTPRPRNDRDPAALEEQWPSLQASFLDVLGCIPEDREARLLPDLSLAAVRKTRNILSLDNRKARQEIVRDAIEHRIPAVILPLVD
jgi:hypothetical protein